MKIDNNEAATDRFQENITDPIDVEVDEALEDEEDTVKLYSKDGPVELFISEPYSMFPFYFFSASLLAAPLLYFTKGKNKDNKSILAEEIIGNNEVNHNDVTLVPENKHQSKDQEIVPKPEKPKLEKPEPEKPEPKKPEPEKTEPEKPEPEKPEPETTEPEKTEPETTEPEKPEPEKTEPEKTEPEKPEPEKPEPEKPEPEKPEPEKPEPEKTEPETTEPEKPEPEKTEPEKTEPEKPEPEKPEPEKPEPEKPEPEKPEPEKPEPEKPEPEKPEPEKPEPEKPEPEKPEPEKPEPEKPEPEKPEPEKTEPEKTEPEKPEPEKPEPEKPEPEKPEPEKPEPEKTESEEPKPEPIFTSKIYYKGELLVTKSTTPFNLQDLRYEERLENSTPTPKKEIKFHISKESADYNAYLAKINDYVYNHDSELNNKVTNAYKTDTDHDGLIDIHDKNPTTWDVSNRDLRMFSSLAYSKTDQIDKIFNEKDKPTMSSIEAEKLGGNTSIDEIANNWKLLHRSLDESGSGGLDYAVFGNGDNGNGTYKNVVVAFRGTDGDAGDLTSNLSLTFGGVPSQANNLAPVREIVKTYASDKIYTTGHSLGGYLAQYFASNYLQKDNNLKDKFARSVLFNPAILKTILLSHPDLKAARKLTDEFLITKYEEADTAKEWAFLNKTNSYVIQGEFVHMTRGLGAYDNTTWIDGDTFSSLDRFTKHKMVNFYSKDNKLSHFFEYGYRMDNHYLSKDSDGDGLTDAEERHIGTDPNNADTDNDGFSDKIEIALESDGTNAEATPNIAGKIINVNKGTSLSADDKPFVSIVTVEEEGKAPTHYGVVMQGVKKGDKIVYSPVDPDNPIILDKAPSISDEQERPTSVISGTSNADQLYTEGNSYLTGNGGEDIFIFKASAFNANAKPSHITDFNADEDKIDLSALKALFSSASSNSSWNELFTTPDTNLEPGKDYVIFNSNEHSLSYKIANSAPVVLAYFDNDAVLAASSIIG